MRNMHWKYSYVKLFVRFSKCRAKTIKNQVKVNEELTADEWRRRFEKERDKCGRLRSLLAHANTELVRWRAGERVAENEQVLEPPEDAPTAGAGAGLDVPQMTNSPSLGSLSTAASAPAAASSRPDLDRQLDEKDDEIAALSSDIAKLRSQLLETDALGTGRRECDAHQQELARLQVRRAGSFQVDVEVETPTIWFTLIVYVYEYSYFTDLTCARRLLWICA